MKILSTVRMLILLAAAVPSLYYPASGIEPPSFAKPKPPANIASAVQEIPDLTGKWKNFYDTEFAITQSGSTFSWRVTKFGRYGDPNETGTGQILDQINIKGTVTTKDGTFPLEGTIAFYSTNVVGRISWNRWESFARIDAGNAAAATRLKIATTASCSDSPNESMQVQGGVSVYINGKTYTSNEKGVIEIDIPPGTYPVSASWKDYVFGYVSQNGLKQKKNEDGQSTITIRDRTETLEFRMLTCGGDGREKARAVITEIGSRSHIRVKRSRADGNGFVGMQLRDGDLVVMSGPAKIKWLKGNGEISFDSGDSIIMISPEMPAGSKAPQGPGKMEILKGIGNFFFPPGDHDYDENGNIIRFGASTHTAMIAFKGTTVSVAHDDTTETTTVTVKEGVVEITPRNPGLARFEVTAGQRAEVSPKGVVGPEPATAQDGPAVTPTKPVFSVNETITIDYSDDKGTGWDWVVIVQPSKEKVATGNFSAINPGYALNLEPATNEMKPRSGRASFPGLPEGDYEAHYISWAGTRNHRGAGNNDLTAVASFKVGNPAPSTDPGPTTKPPTTNPAKDLTGLWRNPGGAGIYRVRQVGSKLVWGLDAVSIGSYANMFQGQITGNTIDGVWEDLPGSPTIGGGRMLLKVESECKFIRVSSVNTYGADVWVKKDSLCDVMGITQRSNAAGAKPTQPTSTKPAGNSVKQTGPVVVVDDPSGVFEKPSTIKPNPATQAKAKPSQKPQSGSRTTQIASNTNQNKTAKPPVVEAIPDDVTQPPKPQSGSRTTQTASNTNQNKTAKPPVVEEIPETASTNIASNRPRTNPPAVEEIPETGTSNPSSSTSNSGGNRSNSSGGSKNNQAKKKPKKEKKPRDPNQPSIWTQLGGAIRQGIEQQPTQPTDTQQQPTQPTQQPDGQCRGGSYWLGTPTPSSWRLGTQGAGVRIPWSTPLGVTGAKIFVFDAGTNNMRVDSALPENANACGLSYNFYMNSAGYFDAYLYERSAYEGNRPTGRPIAGPVRFVVTQ